LSKLIYLDVDDTVFENDYPSIGEPMLEVIEALKKEKAEGAQIILYTLRNAQETEPVVLALFALGLEVDGVDPNKPYYDEIWDDRSRHPREFQPEHQFFHGSINCMRCKKVIEPLTDFVGEGEKFWHQDCHKKRLTG
jgi:hypothetical protein